VVPHQGPVVAKLFVTGPEIDDTWMRTPMAEPDVIRVHMLAQLRPDLERWLRSRGLALRQIPDADPADWVVVLGDAAAAWTERASGGSE
jgi:hypothetical protein